MQPLRCCDESIGLCDVSNFANFSQGYISYTGYFGYSEYLLIPYINNPINIHFVYVNNIFMNCLYV